jgi:hypothetical protein
MADAASLCCITDGDVDSVIRAPEPLTKERWLELIEKANGRWTYLEGLKQEVGYIADVRDDEWDAWDRGLAALLVHRHPELTQEDFVQVTLP